MRNKGVFSFLTAPRYLLVHYRLKAQSADCGRQLRRCFQQQERNVGNFSVHDVISAKLSTQMRPTILYRTFCRRIFPVGGLKQSDISVVRYQVATVTVACRSRAQTCLVRLHIYSSQFIFIKCIRITFYLLSCLGRKYFFFVN